jgi:hypothetical protein
MEGRRGDPLGQNQGEKFDNAIGSQYERP